MKIFVVLSGLCFFLIGCKTTGYDVTVNTDIPINLKEIMKIESILTEKGYNVIEKEKERFGANNLSDVYSFLRKDLTRKEHDNILVVMFFIKDVYSNSAQHFKIAIYNHFVGRIAPEIKAEIDNLGDLTYQHLSNIVGDENVTISRKEWGPPKY